MHISIFNRPFKIFANSKGMKHRVLMGSKNCATVQQECNQCNCQSLSVHNGTKHFFVDSMPGKYRDSPVSVVQRDYNRSDARIAVY